MIPSPETTHPAQYSRLIDWLQSNSVLPRLRTAQLDNDRNGPLQADAHDPKFQLAMTLRDCTCFVRIPADPALPVEAKLADLDKKNWAAKLGYWQAMERRLIEGGYYEGREVPRVRTDCQLERGGGEIPMSDVRIKTG
jgi:inositol-pentakisphosphate 2-kinase